MQLVVRPVHARKEIDVIDAFYKAHGKQHLPQPEIETVCRSAEDGRLYAVDLRPPGSDSRIVALAGVFDVATGTNDGVVGIPVVELAGMALDGPAVGGLGPHTLQDILVWTRVCGLAVEGAGQPICVVSSVVDANEKSIESMKRCGLIATEPPDWMNSIHRSWLSSDHGNVVDFVLQATAVSEAAKNLRNVLKRGMLTRSNRQTTKDDRFDIRFDIGWSRPGHPTLKALARGEPLPWVDQIPSARRIQLGEEEDDFVVQGQTRSE